MKNILGFLSKHTLSAAAIAIIATITLLTSAGTVIKVAGSMTSLNPETPEVKTVRSAQEEELSLRVEQKPDAKTKTVTPTPKSNLALNTNSTVSSQVRQTVLPSPTSTSSSSLQNSNGVSCIITLFGKQYDVTTLQTTHSGGNVFKCGTDQTTLYQSQHGTDLTRMQKYLVTNSGTTVSSSNSTSTGSNIQLDDDTEAEHETEKPETKETETHNETENTKN